MEILIGCIIGLVLGLTGAGGSIFAVPLLSYGLKIFYGYRPWSLRLLVRL